MRRFRFTINLKHATFVDIYLEHACLSGFKHHVSQPVSRSVDIHDGRCRPRLCGRCCPHRRTEHDRRWLLPQSRVQHPRRHVGGQRQRCRLDVPFDCSPLEASIARVKHSSPPFGDVVHHTSQIRTPHAAIPGISSQCSPGHFIVIPCLRRAR